VSKTARTLAVAGFVLAAAFPAAAQEASLQHVRELIAQARAQQGVAPQAPAQAPGSVFTTAGPRVDLSIEDAVARAMERNIDISVARITPQLQDFTLAGLEANYRVNLTSAINNNKTTDLPRVTTQGITAPTTSVREGWSAGIAQNVFWWGGNYSVNWTNSRFNSPSSVNIRNPQFQAGLVANYIQPLWRGRAIDSTRASLLTTRISQKNDEISLTATTATTQANVRNAYWDLVYAIEAVGAAQNSFDLANQLIQDNQARDRTRSARWPPSTSCPRRPKRRRGAISS